ncbi:hypothetical protein [Photobacterium sanguinicancri]|uniref:hypothetical protein n=1 Tax=Photobacterium sanguinicancri TaxID=875932 RepID=UPI003D0E9492
MKPPHLIDGAKVLEWAWSGDNPFGVVKTCTGEVAFKIYGLAICQYADDSVVYRFSCDNNWETVQDDSYISIDEAKEYLPAQYQCVKATWTCFDKTA